MVVLANSGGVLNLRIEQGLLNFGLHQNDALTLCEVIKSSIRNYSHIDLKGTYNKRDQISMASMARLSRMCYELYVTHRLTNLSKEDCDCLYSLPVGAGIEFLHRMLNMIKSSIRESGLDDILEGHSMAKSIKHIMEC